MSQYRAGTTKRGEIKKSNYSPSTHTDTRIRIAGLTILGVGAVIITRMAMLMLVQHGFYEALAAGSHEVYAELFPERGTIYTQDVRNGELYPLAINRDFYIVYLDTRNIPNDEIRESIITTFVELFEFDDVQKEKIRNSVYKKDDPYEPIAEKVPEEIAEVLRQKDLPGVGLIRRSYRYYPEGAFAGPVVGFVGKTEEGTDVGRYGIEGHYESVLAGSGGFFSGTKSATGLWISTAGRSIEEPENGANIVLSLDHTIQYRACTRLKAAMEEYEAASASLIIMDPITGKIIAMCSYPDYNPNEYNKVSSITQYNNTTIFTPYEVGSIFKPLVMAAAMNESLVTPQSVFFDSGEAAGICDKPIRNADLKRYDNQTMTGVLENSINTGMVYVAQQLGKKKLIEYIEDYGFGIKTGIKLDTEASGTINTLYVNSGDNIDCYAATASFGQGFTATPIQMVTAYSAIANGGFLMEPSIIDRIEYPDGKVERYNPKSIRRVLTTRTASLVGGMLVSVVDAGHAGGASVPGYYIAGKTGTAQIAGEGGYSDETNHSFVGYGPVSDPKFVMLVKFEKPKRRFSASTAAPVFGDIASFLVQYYQIPPSR